MNELDINLGTGSFAMTTARLWRPRDASQAKKKIMPTLLKQFVPPKKPCSRDAMPLHISTLLMHSWPRKWCLNIKQRYIHLESGFNKWLVFHLLMRPRKKITQSNRVKVGEKRAAFPHNSRGKIQPMRTAVCWDHHWELQRLIPLCCK